MLFTALVVCLYGVCVFLWTFLSYLRIFHSFRQVTITCEYWPTNVDLNSANMAIEQWGFFNVHTYCDTGQVLIMVISENPWHSHLFRMFGSEAVLPVLKTKGGPGRRSNTDLLHARHTFYPYATRRFYICIIYDEQIYI